MAEPEPTKWLYCNRCKNKTRHILVGSKRYHDSDEDGPDVWGEYKLWTCAGCDSATMEDFYSADYMADGEWESIYHPKRAHSVRAVKYFVNLPSKLATLYREVIEALNDNLRILCAAGLRALVEGVCANKGIPGSNLEAKIEGMKGLLPENIVRNLHSFRFIGNRAVHDLEAPGDTDLALAIDVIEDILNFIYALDYKASLLGKLKTSQGTPTKIQVTPADNLGGQADGVALDLGTLPETPQEN